MGKRASAHVDSCSNRAVHHLDMAAKLVSLTVLMLWYTCVSGATGGCYRLADDHEQCTGFWSCVAATFLLLVRKTLRGAAGHCVLTSKKKKRSVVNPVKELGQVGSRACSLRAWSSVLNTFIMCTERSGRVRYTISLYCGCSCAGTAFANDSSDTVTQNSLHCGRGKQVL